MNHPRHVIIVGAGLAGLACAHRLLKAGFNVEILEAREVLGGRTASWLADGMPVESGLHKYLGIYRQLSALLKEVGAPPDNILTWVDQVAFHVPGKKPAVFGAAPYHHPWRTLRGVLGNNHFIPWSQKLKLLRMTLAGIRECMQHPLQLDEVSVADYARRFGISEQVIHDVLFTSTQAVLFLPADQFSTYAMFAPVVEGLKRGLTFRVGAFKGGMTDVMIEPIVNHIRSKGGQIATNQKVTKLLVDKDRVVGVQVGERELRADHVVLAIPLAAAQQLLKESLPQQPWVQSLLKLPSLSAATIQFELVQPLFPTDHTNFSSTSLCCFAEQSHTTFKKTTGRLSGILFPADEFIGKSDEAILERAYADAESIGVSLRQHVKRYRIVNHPVDFYAMKPGTEKLRPTQATPISGLSLAGDYTKQPFSASMEGAVISGERAAEAAIASIDK